MNKAVLSVVFTCFFLSNCTTSPVNHSDTSKSWKKATLETVLASVTGASLAAGTVFILKGLIEVLEGTIDSKNGSSTSSGLFQAAFGGALLGLGVRLLAISANHNEQ